MTDHMPTWTFLQTSDGGFVDGGYLLCLLTFGIAVVIYTTYGGFHAVVWTDVMQGIVMVGGVMIMLPLALYQVGGLENATRQLASQPTTPVVEVTVMPSEESLKAGEIPGGSFLAWTDESAQTQQTFKTGTPTPVEAGGEPVTLRVFAVSPEGADPILPDDVTSVGEETRYSYVTGPGTT